MSLKSKLKRVERALGEKNKDYAPIMITLYKDDNEEELFKQFRDKYGEDYTHYTPGIWYCTEVWNGKRRGKGIWWLIKS
jgi:hypothetical protein